MLMLRVRVDGSSAAALGGDDRRAWIRISAHLCPARLLVAAPHRATVLLIHSWPPHPSQLPLGLPPAHSAWQSRRFGRPPPALPGSCCPQLCSRRRHRGRTKSLLPRLGLGLLGGVGGKETPEGALNEFKSMRDGWCVHVRAQSFTNCK